MAMAGAGVGWRVARDQARISTQFGIACQQWIACQGLLACQQWRGQQGQGKPHLSCASVSWPSSCSFDWALGQDHRERVGTTQDCDDTHGGHTCDMHEGRDYSGLRLGRFTPLMRMHTEMSSEDSVI